MNIVLPCTGEGARLGLPYSNEIYSIMNGISLFDLKIQKIIKYKKDLERITIIIKSSKSQIIDYLDKYKQELPIVFP